MISGVAEANSREEAIARLRDEGFIVERLDEVGNSPLDMDLKLGGNKTKEKSLAVVCQQFAILLKAGLPITRTIRLIADECEDKTLAGILKNVADDVAAGYGLAPSLEKNGSSLPVTFIESVRAGEDSGSLEIVFSRLSAYYDKVSKTRAKVRNALIYPAFVVVLAVIVVAIVMIFAVPIFTEAYEGMNVELPLPTRMIIASSRFWTRWWWFVAMLLLAASIALKLAQKNEKFHMRWSELSTTVPVLGRITLMGAASEYAGTMSVMMAAGLPIARAVGVTARSLSNFFMGKALASTLPSLEAGRTLGASLSETDVFPGLCVEMTSVGEQTGSMEDTLEVISEYYDNEVDMATSAALSILEPTIIVVLGVMVFILLLAVYMPMFAMYGEGGIAA